MTITKQDLLESLCGFTREAVKGLLLPVEMQEEDEFQPPPRPPDVYAMGLPDFAEAEKKAPLIIHQIITGRDVHPAGALCAQSQAVVRSVFGIYHPNSQEGPLALLGLIERVRVALWRQIWLDRQFELDITAGLDYLIYEKQLPPYYAGEMLSTWKLPSIEREVSQWL